MTKICYIFHSTQADTGIGRLVGSIKNYSQKTWPFEAVVMSGDGLFNLRKKCRFLLNLPKILWLARSCDLVHVFDVYPYGFFGVLIAKIVRRPVVLTAVGTGSVKNINKFLYRHLFALSLGKADQVTAISGYIKDKINQTFPRVSIKVINPGLDNNFWSTKNGNGVNPAAKHDPYVLSVGTFKKRKGFEKSLAFFCRFSVDHPEYRYVIISSRRPEGEYYKKIKSLIESNGLADRVVIISEITDEELRAVYQGARFFILLSEEDNEDVEGFGLVFLEAAAAGLPVIGSANSGAGDAVQDGKNGYLVDNFNVAEVVEKGEAIIANEELREKLSKNSIAFAASLDWSVAVVDYVKIYKQLAL